ncbi:MAG: phytanoyl-CoA dioxygenase family protein [Candidatus Hydrogenedentes bacterium]|nr:phytanoyl-CoA dioxygenase family protein [Candidatus Hydrogenedentota bacterium]
MKPYVDAIHRDIEQLATESLAQLDQAVKIPEGWCTPNGTLFLPAPPGYSRDKQIMVLALNYRNSGALFRSAFDERTVAVITSILGPDVELFMEGQCLYKEPVGGHPKHLHQDAAYFEHRYDGPVASLNYVVETNLENGALYVVPGSHRLGMLKHIDTFSHLGLDGKEWPWERAVPIVGKPGDAIFFHVKTIHGSQQNHSTKPRPVFIHRYRRADDYIVVSGTTTENRGQADQHLGDAAKASQKGFMVSGFRPSDGEMRPTNWTGR